MQPVSGLYIVMGLRSTGALSGLPAVTIILSIPGKIRKSSIALRDDSFGNIRLGSLSVGIAALNRRLNKDDALPCNDVVSFQMSLRSLRSLRSLKSLGSPGNA